MIPPTGAVAGGLATLASSYFLMLQKENELHLKSVCEDDLITAWSHPSPAMHAAAVVIPGRFRLVSLERAYKLWTDGRFVIAIASSIEHLKGAFDIFVFLFWKRHPSPENSVN